ncbi:YopX family protein [Lysinibacillus odysseyi]|uniref:YopX protein domain-containing protein n=2 Tax=Lysinibacillus odysseyi TaxID=202611 RepID=A0A0A3JQJ3_9BACI|nr:YopX family protein [Lysinibacillus odysseyi]KGR89267.1 hypothetical protein CD32_00505 [Lysinibacillus odysseyi 34hs-1 = NBRC 100172]
MREIKFRAWDKKLKEIFPVHELVFNKFNGEPNTIKGYTDDEKDVWNVHGGHFMKYANENRYVLMQYTGLKDKNGKEIFEGDIVQQNYRDLYNQRQAFTGEVVYADCVYWLKNGDEYTFLYDEHRIYDSVVIGNIHENPELLEGVAE